MHILWSSLINIVAQTVGYYVNGNKVITGLPITHINGLSSKEATPEIAWAQITLRNQKNAADGGAYVDSVVVETVPAL